MKFHKVHTTLIEALDVQISLQEKTFWLVVSHMVSWLPPDIPSGSVSVFEPRSLLWSDPQSRIEQSSGSWGHALLRAAISQQVNKTDIQLYAGLPQWASFAPELLFGVTQTLSGQYCSLAASPARARSLPFPFIGDILLFPNRPHSYLHLRNSFPENPTGTVGTRNSLRKWVVRWSLETGTFTKRTPPWVAGRTQMGWGNLVVWLLNFHWWYLGRRGWQNYIHWLVQWF